MEAVHEESCTPEEWLAAWKPDDWNVLRIRCSGGALPVIETWVNDLKVCRFDASKTTHPGFDPGRAKGVAGASGAIGFQVHRGPGWPDGARVFWKDIRVHSLKAAEGPSRNARTIALDAAP